ncbi:MAG: hypothetical protein HYZ49_16930 [Chloroflexi bacterium]|nr:hypothetical protein [Chloroflexota bacterium]
MRRYLVVLSAIGVLVLIVASVSWLVFPEWRNTSNGVLQLSVAALLGVLMFFSGFKDAYDLLTGKKEKNPTPQPTLNIEGNLEQEGQTNVVAAKVQAQQIGGTRIEHADQVVVQGESSSATRELREIKSLLIDAASLAQLGPRDWLPPTAPRPTARLVGRDEERKAVSNLLAPGAKAAITGLAAAVQGTPGVGKTLLAEHLAAGLESQFAGGVLFERLGAGFRDPDLSAPILDRWGGHAFGNRPLPEGKHFTPDAVRALLAGHGSLLVVLDDVWDLKAVAPLLAALPNDACVLITTRSERLARDLRGEVYPLDVLNIDDALKLLRARAHQATDADDELLTELAKALGRHAMALDIAGRSLDRLGRAGWPKAVEAMTRQVREGSGFGELTLPGDEVQVSAVEVALKFSYDDLTDVARERFRKLGAFAPDASFRVEAAAGLWDCPLEEAEGQLAVLVERGLLTRIESLPSPDRTLSEAERSRRGGQETRQRTGGEARFQQHSLLRAYALALLRRASEEDAARERHATVHNALMGDADDRQIFYLMLPDYVQLRHAFEWAIVHQAGLAQALAGNAANLQAAWGFIRDSYDWATRLVAATQTAEDAPAAKAAALVTLGNALSRLATLPNEGRVRRLLEALAAYDDALKYRRPDTAPLAYAMTQNNRAMTQNNRANRLSELASLPGEDRRGRLVESLAAYDEALKHYRPDTAPLDYAMTQNNRATLLSELASLPGEDRRGRLVEALRCAHIALSLFDQIGHAPYSQAATTTLRRVSEEAGELFSELWAELNAGEPPEWLAGVLAQSRAFAALPEDLRRALGTFVEARQRAEEAKSAEAWQAAALAGQSLLDHPDASQLPFEAEQLRAEVASCWNMLGNVLSEQEKHIEALAAFGEAIKLQPNKAMWHRNYASANIDVGNFAAAEAGLARATELEPQHPRLEELRREMEERRMRGI